MTDKLAGPDIAGQTSKACILSELSKKQATQTLFTGKYSSRIMRL